jgi:beta-N-acetylhexosaminidase
VIRGAIGYDGLLMSDDLSMGALSGSIRDRTRAALSAGCDVVLHCNGHFDEMQDVAAVAPPLSGDAGRRAAAALAARRTPEPIDLPAARQAFSAMVADAQGAAVSTS